MRKINIKSIMKYNEPMSEHTTFRVGGNADIFLRPQNVPELVEAVLWAKEQNLPVFLLGEGANILVSERGIRGMVIDTGAFRDCTFEDTLCIAGAGVRISDVSFEAMEKALAGMEFLYSMPGSVGGSVWMNARCYGKSVSDILEYVDFLDENLNTSRYYTQKGDFGYKKSPFQRTSYIILKAGFRLSAGESGEIRSRMERYRMDRIKKGQFLYPCAGSVFKNNRSFGKPTGEIIDSLGFKGYTLGGARVSPYHANFIVNTGSATAGEVLSLIELIERKVKRQFGFELEREIILVGDWEEENENSISKRDIE
ncbi:MAG: UDP-N-acetylenolpyruvoylglucosamine reductase [Spirochaetes bacterium]|nr:MAG: UDP-N-acetylenolpyruvoylglucosamine reductase [Spirochaetota bacterium]